MCQSDSQVVILCKNSVSEFDCKSSSENRLQCISIRYDGEKYQVHEQGEGLLLPDVRDVTHSTYGGRLPEDTGTRLTGSRDGEQYRS